MAQGIQKYSLEIFNFHTLTSPIAETALSSKLRNVGVNRNTDLSINIPLPSMVFVQNVLEGFILTQIHRLVSSLASLY